MLIKTPAFYSGVFYFTLMRILSSLFLIFSCSIICYGQDTAKLASKIGLKTYKNEVGLKSDNDAYLAYGQDRYYTNGLFLTFRHALNQANATKKVIKVIYEIEAGQKMYNPRSGNPKDISRIDRPFAAYLYGGLTFNWLYKSENSLKVSAQIGTIGPNAKGKEAQVFLHKTFGFYPINGWDTQIKNEIGINTTISYDYFLLRSQSKKNDLSINTYINAGNTFAGAGAGILFRTGSLNQFFNTVYNNSVISNNATATPLNSTEVFFYLKPMLHYIAYDATIQGGLSNEDKGPIIFDVKPFVFSQELGVMYSKKRITADFSLTFKSREVKSMARADQYGSISLYYRFN